MRLLPHKSALAVGIFASLLLCGAKAAKSQQAISPIRDQTEEVIECLHRVNAVADAMKGNGADFNEVYKFFVTHFGKPRFVASDTHYLTLGYPTTIRNSDGSLVHTNLMYKMRFETITSKSLFGLVSSTSEPYLMGDCSIQNAEAYNQPKLH